MTPDCKPYSISMTDYNYRNFRASYYDLESFPGPSAGEKIPEVELLDLMGNKVLLSHFLNRPLVIETGSNTCPMYAKCISEMNELQLAYPQVNFLVVYVREAHPGERLRHHQSIREKLHAASQTSRVYGEKRTILCDNLQGDFHLKFGGLPNMVYIVDTNGTVLFRGDWNNVGKVSEVLSTLPAGKIYLEVHFEPTKPTPYLALKALYQGGLLAIFDFIRELPGLLRLHKKANKAYQNDSTLN